MDQLTNALIAAQKLEKKFRQLRNRGEVSESQVADAKRGVELYRELCRQLGVPLVDIDRRLEDRKEHRGKQDR